MWLGPACFISMNSGVRLVMAPENGLGSMVVFTICAICVSLRQESYKHPNRTNDKTQHKNNSTDYQANSPK